MRFYNIYYSYTFGVDTFFGIRKKAEKYARERVKKDLPYFDGNVDKLIEEISPISFKELVKDFIERLSYE